jgi:pyridoxal phosphate enzyme (YggS family)
MSIAENLKKIKLEMSEACLKAGRANTSCSLIAVSKTKPTSQILEAFAAGQTEFGENYVQESLQKISDLNQAAKPVQWHFIGNLQSNKAHQVVGAFTLIHSVDRLSIAQAISKEAQKKSVIQNILMQINVGDEESKSGVSLTEAPQLFDQILALKSVRLCGLMCLPPLVEDIFEQRSYFRILREFMKKHSEKLSDSQKSDFAILSMGTTHDFVSAIFEGATHVRIGTAIFGQRD